MSKQAMAACARTGSSRFIARQEPRRRSHVWGLTPDRAVQAGRPAGLFRQTSQPSAEIRRLHTALDIPLPPRILTLDPEQPATR